MAKAKSQTVNVVTLSPVEQMEVEINALRVHQEAELKKKLEALDALKKEERAKNASKLIAQAVQRAYDALQEAKDLALEFDLEFEFGPEYGMGGVFNGTDWDSSSNPRERTARWQASSNSC